ncbi:TonB-dependent receptor [Nonlabens antarcticus]|uniref:TonB-dependent receptor n=1 Tax=Nonlabens antarcticus TaxID=392714 RepID=UPI0018912D79|nr:TonB-dependent receptor [Nonlabens antarcticus]
MNFKYITTAVSVLLIGTTLIAQDKKDEDRLNGGTITVVKAYDPSVADAFKVKSVPQLNDTIKIKKKAVTYSIFSVPVASTFTPAKGKLSRLKPRKRPEYYDNYARLGLGNYGNIIAEFAGNVEVDKDSDLGIFLNHNSSFGGIDEVLLDDSYSDSALDLSYGHRSRYASYGVTAGARYQRANWYGIYDPLNTQLIGTNPDDTDVAINYLSYGIGGNVDFFDSVFKELKVKLTGLSSSEDAQEFRGRLTPQLSFDIQDTEIGLGLDLDYLKGTFDQQGLRPAQTDYSYLIAGANPKLNLYGDNYKLELGAKVNYLNDFEGNQNEFNFYPDINASYRVLDDQIIAYTQLLGGLDMNSLQQFADENVFLAPAITIKPTDRLIDAQLGLKGKVTNNLGYKIYGGYKKENDRYFYTKDVGRVLIVEEGATLGNVFYTQYADLETMFYGASLSVDVSSKFNLTLSGKSMSYEVTNGDDFENVASQLPEFTADLVGMYQITDKLDVGATVYYVGERDVYRNGLGVESLDSFVDLNLDVNYKINSKLTAFIRGNNLTGGNYEYYLDYPVQDLQVLGGVVYKFDF